MPLNLASPGILVREVDLTLGRVDPTSDKIGGIVGPFAQGPVGTPIRISSENDLLNNFPQTEYFFELLNQQLEFFAETVKNMIVIVNDLIASY